jgi:hypothetical protein
MITLFETDSLESIDRLAHDFDDESEEALEEGNEVSVPSPTSRSVHPERLRIPSLAASSNRSVQAC